MEHEIPHPTDNRITLSVIHHKYESPRHGAPPRLEKYEITAAAFNDGITTVDITDFINEHCDHLFSRWEEQVNDSLI